LPCSAPLYAQGANLSNWPNQFPNNQCGTPNPALPTGSMFTQAASAGSQAQINLVASTNGAIGYASPDFVQPVVVGGLVTANLQNQWDVGTNVSGTPTFVAPTLAGTTAAMASVTPSFNSLTRGNPLAWSLQGVVPNPVVSDAYPIAGFTWMEAYQCYNSGVNMPVQLSGVLFSIYGAPYVGQIINSNGFITPPYVWLAEIYQLLGDDNLRPRNTWDSGTHACTGKVGAT
jgi:hypothetical protein